MNLYTIGAGGKSAKQFFELLKSHHIQKLLDIRLKNQSQLLGFSKGKDLQYFLKDLLNIEYEHVPMLAPTPELLQNYMDKKRKDTYKRWDIYEKEFKKLLVNRDAISIFNKASKGYNSIVILCSEPKADKCHRRLVAEFIHQNNLSIAVSHL